MANRVTHVHVADRRRVADGRDRRARQDGCGCFLRTCKALYFNRIRRFLRVEGRANQCRMRRVCWGNAAKAVLRVPVETRSTAGRCSTLGAGHGSRSPSKSRCSTTGDVCIRHWAVAPSRKPSPSSETQDQTPEPSTSVSKNSTHSRYRLRPGMTLMTKPRHLFLEQPVDRSWAGGTLDRSATPRTLLARNVAATHCGVAGRSPSGGTWRRHRHWLT